MNILIIGGNGGIGQGLIRQLLREEHVGHLYATYRREKPTLQDARLSWVCLDASDEAQVRALSEQTEHIDCLINCVGMLHTPNRGPEKNYRMLDGAFFMQNMQTNVLPSVLLAKYFTEHLARSTQPRFVVLSAKLGSIEDNALGGWYSYRSSKAALNMFLKTLAIEWQRRIPQGCVLALHPGTTDTELSKPFQANVAKSTLFSTDACAANLLRIIMRADAQLSGQFVTYTGQRLAW